MRTVVLLSLVATVLLPGAHAGTSGPSDADLAAGLRAGGYVVFVRTPKRGCADAAVRRAATGLRSLGRGAAAVRAPKRCIAAAARAAGRRAVPASTDTSDGARKLVRSRPRGTALALGSARVGGLPVGAAGVFRDGKLVARIAPARWAALKAALASPPSTPASPFRSWAVPRGTHPHDVAPAPDGTVWYTAQFTGGLGKLDPGTGTIRTIPLGRNSAPHGVIVGPDGAPWITDPGLNAIVRVDPVSEAIRAFPMPVTDNVDLNTAVFADGILWFTGNAGWYGRLDPSSGEVRVWRAPRGAGPYGITATPSGDVYYASLQGNYVGRIATSTGDVTVLEPPTSGQGARRVWSDSRGRIWVSEWNAGKLGMYDPAAHSWREWSSPQVGSPYAVYVDDRDIVWLSDFANNAIVRFDPATETFASFRLPRGNAAVRQLLGRPGELWLPESGTDHVSVLASG